MRRWGLPKGAFMTNVCYPWFPSSLPSGWTLISFLNYRTVWALTPQVAKIMTCIQVPFKGEGRDIKKTTKRSSSMHNKAMTPKWRESMATLFQSCPRQMLLHLNHFSPITTRWIYKAPQSCVLSAEGFMGYVFRLYTCYVKDCLMKHVMNGWEWGPGGGRGRADTWSWHLEARREGDQSVKKWKHVDRLKNH